jgi:hypothetical protein
MLPGRNLGKFADLPHGHSTMMPATGTDAKTFRAVWSAPPRQIEGSADSQGMHFPGAEPEGSHASYLPGEGVGLGLVCGDGWRVPHSGSDCAVYHAGIGHPIGLPHPEPSDDSVMGLAQYNYWLTETWIDEAQKRALGWSSPASKRFLHSRAISMSRISPMQSPSRAFTRPRGAYCASDS